MIESDVKKISSCKEDQVSMVDGLNPDRVNGYGSNFSQWTTSMADCYGVSQLAVYG